MEHDTGAELDYPTQLPLFRVPYTLSVTVPYLNYPELLGTIKLHKALTRWGVASSNEGK